ncbi:MAG TPA: hypothetical protein VF096_06000 [Azonexus sp.]
MSNRRLMSALLAALVVVAAGSTPLAAAEEPIFGSQLMTQQERNEHRLKMHSAKTAEEREAVRAQHHQQMLERARQQGVTLPETPPPQGAGRGMGPGMGMGGGPGPARTQ